MRNTHHEDDHLLLVDAVPDPVGASSSRPFTEERTTQRMADSVGILSERTNKELRDGGQYSWWQPIEISTGGGAQFDLVAHADWFRRSARTVSMGTP